MVRRDCATLHVLDYAIQHVTMNALSRAQQRVGIVAATHVQRHVVMSAPGVVACVTHHAKQSVRIQLAMRVLRLELRR